MNIHEHQAKELLKRYGAPVFNGFVIFYPNEIKKASKMNLFLNPFFLKSDPYLI